jgi:small subunit ribosomal protein S17
MKRSTKVHAHDEENTCAAGDKVMIEECRPLSKNKSWRVIEILERAV